MSNDLAEKINSAVCKRGARINQILESFECNQPSNAHDAQLVGRDLRARRFGMRRRKTSKINSVINAVNFRRRTRTTLAKQVAAVIRLGRDKFRCVADLAEKLVTAEVLHKILPVRGDT